MNKINQSNKPPKLYTDIHQVMHMGKYKNKTLSWILAHDPGYLDWVNDNCTNVQFSSNIKEKISMMVYQSK